MKHISDIKKFERCDKLLWWANKSPHPFRAYVTFNENILDLTLKRLNINTYLKGEPNDPNTVFFKNENKYDVFVSMRFEYENLRVKIPIMVKKQGGYFLYYPYASCYPKESEAQVIADNEWVLSKLGIRIVGRKVAHLNPEYCRQGDLDVEGLIKIVDYLYNDRNHPKNKINQLVSMRKRDLSTILKAMDEVLLLDEMEKKRTNVCTRRHKCEYFDVCFKEEGNTSIYHLVSTAMKFKLYEQGVRTIEQLDFEQIEGTRHQFAQYMAAKNKTLFFDHLAVEGFFKDIAYPISYLDFEWETFAFPPYDSMHPYDVLTFQYSLHIEDQNHNLQHQEFLGRNDCREEFIKHLIAHIPKTGSVMCFNVEGAEKLRLKQLAKQFPKYARSLQQIWERMIDLATPFSSGLIYDNKMEGMYSLKKLVSIFTDYSYDDLCISHGMEAVRSYIHLEEDENPKLVENLLKYCEMDTYAMFLIYHWILRQF